MASTQTVTGGEGTFAGVGGLTIFFRSWRPSIAPRGVVAIVPGFNSHSGYYDWVANELVARGLAVYAIDLRGRGKSDGERFYVDTFADYASDVATFERPHRIRRTSPQTPAGFATGTDYRTTADAVVRAAAGSHNGQPAGLPDVNLRAARSFDLLCLRGFSSEW
jgi:alpha-beta hydrolase superfamily lysophospholipase